MHTVGLVLHPRRDSAEAVQAVLDWAGRNDVEVLGAASDLTRLNCAGIRDDVIPGKSCWGSPRRIAGAAVLTQSV